MPRLGLLVAVAIVGYSGAAAAKPKLVVTAPADAVGDGATAVEVIVRVEPPEAAAELEELQLVATAGTVGKASPAGAAGVAYSFVPPRVAAKRSVTLTAVARSGHKPISASASLTAMAPTAQVETRSTGGAFDLQVPERVRLGRDAEVELSIARRDGEAPELYVSTGKVSALEPDGDRLRAVYTPPASGAPQLAIVAAVSADRAELDWARVPLVGQGRLNLRSEPNASVAVRVGGIDFGPVRTDAKGKAQLVVEAPPGVERATTLATDELGNLRKGTLPLKPPPFVRMLAICPGVGGRTLFLVVDAHARPAEGATVTATASLGAVSEPTADGAGVVAADYSLSADASFGDTLRIDAALSGGTVAGSCETTIPGEMPERVSVAFDGDGFTAGSGAPVRFTASPVYAGKLPPIEVALAADVDFGELSFDGRAGEWTVPNELGGRTSAQVTLRAGKLVQKAPLALRAGAPVAPVIQASRVELLADGHTPVDLLVEVRDAYGNPVRDAVLAATARGSVSEFRADGAGRYRATYVPPHSFEALIDTVRIAAGDAEGSVAIALNASRSRFSVAVTGGYLTNLGKVSAPALIADAAYRPPVLGERLAVGIEAGFYASDDERAAAGGGERVKTSVTAVPVLARATYTVPFGGVAAYGGLSVGALLSERGIESPGAGRIVNSGPTVAVSGLLGGEVRLGPGRAVLEVAFLYAAIDDAELDGNAGGVRVGAGYRYDL